MRISRGLKWENKTYKLKRSIQELFALHLSCQTRRKRENSHPNHLEDVKRFPEQEMSPREGEFEFSKVDSDDCGLHCPTGYNPAINIFSHTYLHSLFFLIRIYFIRISRLKFAKF